MPAQQIKGLSTGAQKFWNLSSDPFIKDPPPYEKFDQLLIETQNVSRINDIIAQFLRDNLGKSVLLRGHRGSGKSTLLRYTHRKLKQSGQFSIYCNINHRDPQSAGDIKFDTHKQILQYFLKAVRTDAAMRTLDISDAGKALNSDDVYMFEFAIYDLLDKIASFHPKYLCIIDDIDKLGYEKWPLLERYFIENQGFFTRLKSSEDPSVVYNGYVIVALQPYQLVSKLASRQLEYLGEMELVMQRWTLEEIIKLIENRLQFACTLSEFRLSNYFDKDVIRRIWIENVTIPRFCSNACKSLLELGFRENVKPIKAVFTNSHPDAVKGVKDSPLFSELEVIHSDMIKQFPRVHLALRELFSDDNYEVSDSIEELLKIYAERSIQRTENGKALVIHRLARNEVDSKRNEVYTIEPDVSTFFDKLLDFVRGDMEAFRPYLYNMFI